MPAKNTAAAPEHVACKMCMKEVPLAKAVVPEATDYVAYFCGAACYDRWQNQPGKPSLQDDIPTVAVPL